MHVLVAYDVSTDTREGRGRLRKVAEVCKNFGQRVQKSVFECSLNDVQFEDLMRRLKRCMSQKEDSLRLYRLTEPKDKHIWVFGRTKVIDLEGPLVL